MKIKIVLTRRYINTMCSYQLISSVSLDTLELYRVPTTAGVGEGRWVRGERGVRRDFNSSKKLAYLPDKQSQTSLCILLIFKSIYVTQENI